MVNNLQTLITATGLLLLHAPDGHTVFINPDEVTVLHQKLNTGQGNFTDKATCMVNTTDGKFITVIESCMTIIDAIKKR